jgi:hypothetical protein
MFLRRSCLPRARQVPQRKVLPVPDERSCRLSAMIGAWSRRGLGRQSPFPSELHPT